MLPKCFDCGQFTSTPVAWKMRYSGFPPMPDEEVVRCAKCFEKYGPFDPQSGIKPECSCGIFEATHD